MGGWFSVSIQNITVPRIRCDRLDEIAGRCTSRLYGDDTLLSEDKVRTLARERGWSTEPDLCPSHRNERT